MEDQLEEGKKSEMMLKTWVLELQVFLEGLKIVNFMHTDRGAGLKEIRSNKIFD